MFSSNPIISNYKTLFKHKFTSHLPSTGDRRTLPSPEHSQRASRGRLAGAARDCPSHHFSARRRRPPACGGGGGPHNRQPPQLPFFLPHSSTTPPRSMVLRRAGRPWKSGSASPGHGSGLTRWLAASPLRHGSSWFGGRRAAG
jgi:hypothetical protein